MHEFESKLAQIREMVEDLSRSGRAQGPAVQEVMTPRPSTISPETSVLEVVKLIVSKRFRHLLVTDETNRLVGVISDRDLVSCVGPGRDPDKVALAELRAADIMSTDLITVGPYTPLADAVIVLVEHGISCLPVLAGESLLGILTSTDLHMALAVLLRLFGRFGLATSAVEPAGIV